MNHETNAIEEAPNLVRKSARIFPSWRVWVMRAFQSWWRRSLMSWIKLEYLLNLGVWSWGRSTQRREFVKQKTTWWFNCLAN